MKAPDRPNENMPGGGRHVVLASTGGEAFASLRRSATPRRERYALGRALRKQVPRSALARWRAPAGRRDPVQHIVESHEGRLEWLIPVRVSRMMASPYAFLRGTAAIMAEDFAGLPATGITPVICGDAHLGNFGFYASPERELVFDLNDFDESHPGAWEWDLRRLVTSVWVAGRQNGSGEEACGDAVAHCVASYRTQVSHLAEQPLLARSYERLDLDRLWLTATRDSLRKEIERAAKRARRRTSDRALPRFTELRDGTRRIIEEPPLITRPGAVEADQIAVALDAYLQTTPPHWARVLAATPWSTSPTRSSASAPLDCVPSSRCARAAARTTSFSFSSSRPAGRWSRALFTASRRGTSTRVSGWLSTNRLFRRWAIRCSGGRLWDPTNTMYAGSGI